MSRKSRQSHQAAPETPRTSTATSASGPDVVQLSGEKLETGTFPAPQTVDFRVYFDPQVYAAMVAHAAEDTTFEICGVMVGDLRRDAGGPFVNVRNYIRCDSAEKKFAEVTFTHESWSHINKEMDTKYQDQRIVGWYHSHPNFGIFLSDRDFFIQQNFFSAPGQIALVIDPVRKIEGVFEWRAGGTAPTPHYWVGSKLQLAPAGPGGTEMPEADTPPAGPSEAPPQLLGTATTVLSWMCLFLMGWLLSSWMPSVDRRAVVEATVARFGLWKVMRPGLEEGLASLQKRMELVTEQVKTLSEDHLKRSTEALEAEKDDAGKAALQKIVDQNTADWRKTRNLMSEINLELDHLDRLYSLTPQERDAVVYVMKQIELQLHALEREKGKSKPAPAPAPAKEDENKKS